MISICSTQTFNQHIFPQWQPVFRVLRFVNTFPSPRLWARGNTACPSLEAQAAPQLVGELVLLPLEKKKKIAGAVVVGEACEIVGRAWWVTRHVLWLVTSQPPRE